MIPDRYNWANFKRAAIEPAVAVSELSRIFEKLKTETLRRSWNLRHKKEYDNTVNVMSGDWDNLLILDACRYDIFEETNTIDGDLDYIYSKGSHSQEFYEKTFEGKSYTDTIYVTANPYGAVIGKDVFAAIETSFSGQVHIDREQKKISEVKDETGDWVTKTHSENVHPRKINDLALELLEKHSEKRLVIHYMQPHSPYLGKRASELREQLYEDHNIIFTNDISNDYQPSEGEVVITELLNAAKEGYLSTEEIREVYTENLEIVLQYIEDLLGELDGKTVVTSDHGELLGEKRAGVRYRHPKGVYAEELRKVPWLTIPSDSRRTITTGQLDRQTETSQEDLEKQLELLGYA